MPDTFLDTLAFPGVPWLAAAVFVAGLVYGFAGFGSALIFIPFASAFVPPAVAIVAFSGSALASFVTLVPAAWRVADRPAVLQMIVASVAVTPIGVAILRFAPADAIRTVIAILTLGTLAALLAGWRRKLDGGLRGRIGIGVLSGIAGGSTGLNGPPVILFNLGTEGQPVAVTRANLTLFLTCSSLLLLPQIWIQGLLPPFALWLGVLLLPPYAAGNLIGARLFDPARAGLYRAIAYALIGAAGVSALPVWT